MGHIASSAAKCAIMAAVIVTLPGMQGRLNNLDQRLLDGHNRERSARDVPPLRWDAKLAANARSWAEHLSRTGKFEHSPNQPGQALEGENIWGGTSEAYGPEAMVNLWIEEKMHFVPGTFPANSGTGQVSDVSHYTQLIWRDTTAVGCGLARFGDEEILVCRYSQPGNIVGRKPF